MWVVGTRIAEHIILPLMVILRGVITNKANVARLANEVHIRDVFSIPKRRIGHLIGVKLVVVALHESVAEDRGGWVVL